MTCVPTSPLLQFDPQLFRILLLRRLRLPLPLTRVCRCRQIDLFGHHRAACSGVLGRRGYAVESAAARVCREAGARVTTNVMLRDLDLFLPQRADGRRLEVVADGLPLFDGAQLAVDTTLVSPLHCDGSARPGAPFHRWGCPHPSSCSSRSFISQLAKAKSRAEPFVLRRRVEQAWRLRWGAMLSCAAARAFASSLLERRVFHQPVGQGEVQGGAVRLTQESGTTLAAQVGRNAVLCGSKGVCFITLGASHRNPRSGRGFQALRVGALSGCVECRVVASP